MVVFFSLIRVCPDWRCELQAVVAKLQGADASSGSSHAMPPLAEDAGGAAGMMGGEVEWVESGGGSKLASAKRVQIAKARQESAGYRPPRPSSAPPGRQPLPQSRPSSATPASKANNSAGGLGISGVGVQGRGVPPRPSSAMHRPSSAMRDRGPNSRPGSAMSKE